MSGRNEGANALGSGFSRAGAASSSHSNSVARAPPRTPSITSFVDSGLGLSHHSVSITSKSQLNPVAAKALLHRPMSHVGSEVSSRASALSSNTRVNLEQSVDRQFVLEQQNFELQATNTALHETIKKLEMEKRAMEIAQDVLQYVVD